MNSIWCFGRSRRERSLNKLTVKEDDKRKTRRGANFSRLSLHWARFAGVILFALLVVSSTALAIDDPPIDNLKELFKQAQKENRHGRFGEAEKLFRRIIEINPASSDAKLALAYLLAKQRKIHEAYELSFNVVKNEPRNSHAFAVLGATFLTAGKFSEARTCFGTALGICPKDDLAR